MCGLLVCLCVPAGLASVAHDPAGDSGSKIGRLSPATKARIRGFILEKRLGNRAIVQELAGSGVVVTAAAISYHRRLLLPELQASDLESIQAGAASYLSRAADLSAARAALIGAAVVAEKQGEETVYKLSTRADAGFLLMVASKIEEQLQRLSTAAEKRIYDREKIEQGAELVAVEKGRLKIEFERAGREAEKHALEMRMTLRELEELEREDEAEKAGEGAGAG